MIEVLNHMALWIGDLFLLATILLAAVLLLMGRTRHAADRLAFAWVAIVCLLGLVAITLLPSWPRMNLSQVLAVDVPAGGGALPAREPELRKDAFKKRELQGVEQPASFSRLRSEVVQPASAASTIPDHFMMNRLALPWSGWMALGWLSGAALGGFWILLGGVRATRLLLAAQPAPDWLWREFAPLVGSARRKPGLRTSRQIGSAVAIGTFFPSILLPEHMASPENRSSLRAALAHEWAHIRHGDLWLLAFERLLLPLLFAHPLYWWLRRRIREDQELLADAAACGNDPVEYAEALLTWARLSNQSTPAGMAALSMWDRPPTLTRRIEMVLNITVIPVRRGSRWGRWLSIALIVVTVGGATCFTLQPATGQPPAAATPATSDSAEPAKGKSRVDATRQADPAAAPTAHQSVRVDVVIARVAAADLPAALKGIGITQPAVLSTTYQVVLDAQENAELEKRLRGLPTHAIESRPHLVVLNGQTANCEVGQRAPLLLVNESVNGRRQERVESKDFGIKLQITPQVAQEKTGDQVVLLNVAADISRVLPRANDAKSKDIFRYSTQKMSAAEAVKVGQTLVVAPDRDAADQLPDGIAYLITMTPVEVRTFLTSEAGSPPPQSHPVSQKKPDSVDEPDATKLSADLATKLSADEMQSILARLQELQKLFEQDRAHLQAENEKLQKQLQAMQLAANANRDKLHEIDLHEATLELEAAQRKYEIQEALFKRAIISEPERGKAALQVELAKIQLQRAQAADNVRKVRELDVQEAKLILEAAESNHEQIRLLRERGFVGPGELSIAAFAIERAKLKLQRAQTLLDSLPPANKSQP